jgi:hypothetical protein
MTDGWKKWFWRSAGFGSGAVLMLAVIAASVIWWIDRPKPSKPWNTKAISAEYDYTTTEGDDNNIVFSTLCKTIPTLTIAFIQVRK